MKRDMTMLLVVLAIPVLAAGALLWNFDQPPSAYYLVQDIRQGSTKDEVTSILGDPDSIHDNGRTLAYSRPFAWGILYVYLGDDGKLTHYDYDK